MYEIRQRPSDKAWCIYLKDFAVVIAEFSRGVQMATRDEFEQALQLHQQEIVPKLLHSLTQFVHRCQVCDAVASWITPRTRNYYCFNHKPEEARVAEDNLQAKEIMDQAREMLGGE